MMNLKPKQLQPNHLLRQQRLERGWTLERAADELYKLCGSRVSKRGDINAKMIGSWERGEHPPSLFYQGKLSLLYGKSLQELGLIGVSEAEKAQTDETLQAPEQAPTLHIEPVQQQVPSHLRPTHPIDFLSEASQSAFYQQLGAWLVLEACNFAQLVDEGWTLDTLMEALQVVLKGVQAMPKFSRRRLLQLGAAAVVGNVVVPEGKHLSAEDRMQLCSALGESIGSGWRLFHTAGNAQVLAVSHAQLILVQQSHAMLPSRDRSRFYSSVYNLMGKALHFQERHQEALEAHVNAHVAAMGSGDVLHIVQSLICQADSYQALGQHSHAIEAIEEALRLIGNPADETLLRAKAHLLACWAENAIALGEHITAQEKMEASAAYLDWISPNEEFDRAHWLQIAGKHAFMTGDYPKAIEHYSQALDELPPNWVIQQAFTLVPLMVAYACQRNREASIAAADKAVAVVSTLNAPSVNRQFTVSVQRGLCGAFPHDEQVQRFMADLPCRLPCLRNTQL